MLRKLALSKLLLGIALAVGVDSTARADLVVTFSLVQVGGTYDGVEANPGDTLVLSIEYEIGDVNVTVINPGIVWGPEVTSFDGGTETGSAAWSGGAVTLSPVVTGDDIALFAPNQAFGWEKATLNSAGAGNPCVSGACTSMGTVSFTLSGESGVIDIAPEWITGGTYVGYTETVICVDGPCWNASPFTVVPEPATASLLGLGLLGMALVSRRRRR